MLLGLVLAFLIGVMICISLSQGLLAYYHQRKIAVLSCTHIRSNCNGQIAMLCTD